MGYQRLVEHALGVQLDKGETTSDWLQRPLTGSQERYAALDVAYLPALCQQQVAELEQRGMYSWMQEEAQQLLDQTPDTDPDGVRYYQRFSQAWKLAPEKKWLHCVTLVLGVRGSPGSVMYPAIGCCVIKHCWK